MEQDSSEISKMFFLYFSLPYAILNVLTRREGKLTNLAVSLTTEQKFRKEQV